MLYLKAAMSGKMRSVPQDVQPQLLDHAVSSSTEKLVNHHQRHSAAPPCVRAWRRNDVAYPQLRPETIAHSSLHQPANGQTAMRETVFEISYHRNDYITLCVIAAGAVPDLESAFMSAANSLDHWLSKTAFILQKRWHARSRLAIMNFHHAALAQR